jgi:hypothetical protein
VRFDRYRRSRQLSHSFQRFSSRPGKGDTVRSSWIVKNVEHYIIFTVFDNSNAGTWTFKGCKREMTIRRRPLMTRYRSGRTDGYDFVG